MPGFAALGRAAASFTELVFPRRCAGCNAAGATLCPRCVAGLQPVPQPQCARCGLPLPQPSAPCRHCAEFPLAIDGLRAPYPYEPPLREAILRLKYAGARVASRDLAALMARYIQAQPLPVDALAPVPLHPQRARDRGFNQAEALAGELGRLVQLPVLHHAVQRVRNTPPQARQPNRHDRWRNMDGAFQADPAVVSGRRILVVDDVCTTGATVNACGIALQQAGAAAVWGLTLARAL